MRSRLALAAALPALFLWWPGPSAQGADLRTCTWGGTPAAPTGEASFEPGLTWTPLASPIPFRATGPADGDGCKGRVTFDGVIEAGSSCASVTFSGRVKGVDGVAAFRGPGQAVNTHEDLFDEEGNRVGFNDPWTLNGPFLSHVVNHWHELECSGEGYDHAVFSSVITVYGGA